MSTRKSVLLLAVAFVAIGGLPQATAAAQAPTPIEFEKRLNLALDGPHSVVIDDFTGDGLADIAYSSDCGCNVTMLPQKPDGSLGTATVLTPTSTFGNEKGLASGDVTGDGKSDVAMAVNDGVDIFAQAGSTLTAPTHITLGGSASEVAIADFTGDTRNDILVSAYGGSYLLTKNVGPGFTTTSPGFPLGRETEAADVTGDGAVDAVVAGFNAAQVTVYVNDGTGTFATGVTYTTSANVGAIAVGDFNNDGRADVAAAVGGNANSKLNLLFQKNDGTLAPRVVMESKDIPDAATVGDLNGDGRDDLVVTHGVWISLGVYLQGPTGLGPEKLYPIDYDNIMPKGLATGDVNGDAKVDIAWGDDTGNLYILRQRAELRLTAPSRVKPGATASFSVHLGPHATSSNKVVTLYESSGGGPFHLITSLGVNGAGNLSGGVTDLTRNTELKAVWDGDSRSATVETSVTIKVPAVVVGKLSGFRTTSGAYKIYSAGDVPVFTAVAKPNNSGGIVTFKLEKQVHGAWRFVDNLQAKFNSHTQARVNIHIAAGVMYRVNAAFYGSKKNARASSKWSYLRTG